MAIGPEEKSLLSFLDGLESESDRWREDAERGSWERAIKMMRAKIPGETNAHPMFEAPFVASGVERKAALLTENKPSIKVAARIKGFPITADILQRTIEADWEEQGMESNLETLAYHLEVFGCSFMEIVWDPFADNGAGGLRVGTVDPRCVGIDPSVVRVGDLDKGQYIWTETLDSVWELQRRFPGRGAEIKPDLNVSPVRREDKTKGGSRVISALSRVFKIGGQPSSAIPRCRVRNYCFYDPKMKDDGSLAYPFGRHVTRINQDLLVWDEANEYWDGGYPLVMCDGKLDLEHPWGHSDADQLRKLQEAVNRIGHIFVANTIMGGNTWVTVDQGALTPDAKNTLSNMEAIVIEKAFGRSVTREPPPQIPPHMLDFVKVTMGLANLFLGLDDGSMQGKGRVELRSGVQLEGLQSAAQILVRALARRVEQFLERLGQKWISRIFQFYMDDRIFTYLGTDGNWQQFQFERMKLMEEIRQEATKKATEISKKEGRLATQAELQGVIEEQMRIAWRRFRFRITPGSSLAVSKVQRAMMYAELAKNGLMPRKRVLMELGFDDPDEIIKEVVQEMQTLGPPPQQAAGGGKKKSVAGMKM